MDSNLLSISLDFDLTASPKTFVLNDDTDYSAVVKSNVLGLLRAVAPDGIQFYNNTSYASPTIDYNSDIFSAAFPLPLETDGTVKQGIYTFYYKAKIEDEQQNRLIISNDSAVKTFVIVGNYASQILDATASTFKCIDTVTTNLTIADATYSSSTGNTTVTINETLGVLTALATFQYTVDTISEKTFTQNYVYVTPSICLNWTSDNCCSSMVINDTTAYASGATVTRLHTVHYPDGMVTPIADLTSPLQELTISPIWTGTWTDTFTADIEVTIGIIDVTDQARGVKEHKVTADAGLCEAYSCIGTLATTYAAALITRPQWAADKQKYIAEASAAFMAYSIGKQCGKTDIDQYLTILQTAVAECDCGCDCGDCADGTPTLVVGCCGNVAGSDFTIVLTDPTTSITISSNTVGTTTTFTIGVSESFVNALITAGIAAASINDLADVNTSNISPVTGQCFIWDNATGKWIRGTPQLTLQQLTNIDDTGLANLMVLYYDSGTQTFKFKLLTTPALNDLTDVVISGLTTGQTIVYDGSNFVNIDFKYVELLDVDPTSLANGHSFKWDSGTSRFVVFTPVTAFNDLSDVVLAGVADNDRLINTTGTGWQNLARPTYSDLTSYQSGYTRGSAGFFDSGYSYDRLTNTVTLRGVVANSNGAVASAQWIASVPVGIIPAATVPIRVTLGLGSTNFIGIAEVAMTTGKITVYSHYNSTGVVTAGVPAGNISLDGVSYNPTT